MSSDDGGLELRIQHLKHSKQFLYFTFLIKGDISDTHVHEINLEFGMFY